MEREFNLEANFYFNSGCMESFDYFKLKDNEEYNKRKSKINKNRDSSLSQAKKCDKYKKLMEVYDYHRFDEGYYHASNVLEYKISQCERDK